MLGLMPGTCVNLPRWGLKQFERIRNDARKSRVNLPRWGLKRKDIREAKGLPSDSKIII